MKISIILLFFLFKSFLNLCLSPPHLLFQLQSEDSYNMLFEIFCLDPNTAVIICEQIEDNCHFCQQVISLYMNRDNCKDKRDYYSKKEICKKIKLILENGIFLKQKYSKREIQILISKIGRKANCINIKDPFNDNALPNQYDKQNFNKSDLTKNKIY